MTTVPQTRRLRGAARLAGEVVAVLAWVVVVAAVGGLVGFALAWLLAYAVGAA